jgi:hypothetical protein
VPHQCTLSNTMSLALREQHHSRTCAEPIRGTCPADQGVVTSLCRGCPGAAPLGPSGCSPSHSCARRRCPSASVRVSQLVPAWKTARRHLATAAGSPSRRPQAPPRRQPRRQVRSLPGQARRPGERHPDAWALNIRIMCRARRRAAWGSGSDSVPARRRRRRRRRGARWSSAELEAADSGRRRKCRRRGAGGPDGHAIESALASVQLNFNV